MPENQAFDILDAVVNVLQDRQQNPSDQSYTSSLFTKGTAKICEKISEEAGELVEAAMENDSDQQHLIHEAADLVFHVLVLLVHQNLSLNEIRTELGNRFGTSGLVEKANRNNESKGNE